MGCAWSAFWRRRAWAFGSVEISWWAESLALSSANASQNALWVTKLSFLQLISTMQAHKEIISEHYHYKPK
jgi:hypothetical protein